MSVVHIMFDNDWIRIPHPEVRRVTLHKIADLTQAGHDFNMGLLSLGNASSTVKPREIIRITIYLLSSAVTSMTIDFHTEDTRTNPTENGERSIAHLIREDLFLHDVEQDITWTLSPTGWNRSVGRPESTDRAYRTDNT